MLDRLRRDYDQNIMNLMILFYVENATTKKSEKYEIKLVLNSAGGNGGVPHIDLPFTSGDKSHKKCVFNCPEDRVLELLSKKECVEVYIKSNRNLFVYYISIWIII